MSDSFKDWPLVDINGPHIRAVGELNKCSCCAQEAGNPHSQDCVCVTKKVELAYIVTIPADIPHFWDAEMVEFHRNEGSWCASNLIQDLQTLQENNNDDCICNYVVCDFIKVVDDKPTTEDQ